MVLKGFDAELNRTVAIKVLAPHLARSSAARQRFVREGRAAAAVVHENVVAIHQVDTSGRLPHLVMHFVDGVSLQRHVDTIGPLPVCDALRIAAQTAAGLAAAHRQGIIHRDVKPANILIGGSGQRVWITDFGLARAVDDASLTRTGFIAGTPHYMSPEQARGGSVGPVSDLFSLGAVVYFMLAARPPWRAERSLAVLHRIVGQPHRPLRQINADVPRQVSDLVDRLLSKQPGPTRRIGRRNSSGNGKYAQPNAKPRSRPFAIDGSSETLKTRFPFPPLVRCPRYRGFNRRIGLCIPARIGVEPPKCFASQRFKGRSRRVRTAEWPNAQRYSLRAELSGAIWFRAIAGGRTNIAAAHANDP